MGVGNGPSASLRAMGDAIVIPLLKLLGYEIGGRIDRPLHTCSGPSPEGSQRCRS